MREGCGAGRGNPPGAALAQTPNSKHPALWQSLRELVLELADELLVALVSPEVPKCVAATHCVLNALPQHRLHAQEDGWSSRSVAVGAWAAALAKAAALAAGASHPTHAAYILLQPFQGLRAQLL